jgi:hypothetical protein
MTTRERARTALDRQREPYRQGGRGAPPCGAKGDEERCLDVAARSGSRDTRGGSNPLG